MKKIKNRRVKITFRADSSNAGSSRAPVNSSIGFTGFLLTTKRKVKPTKGPDIVGGTPKTWGFSSHMMGRSFSGDAPRFDEWQDVSDLIDLSTGELRTDDPEVQELMSQSVKIDWSVLEWKLNLPDGNRTKDNELEPTVSHTSSTS